MTKFNRTRVFTDTKQVGRRHVGSYYDGRVFFIGMTAEDTKGSVWREISDVAGKRRNKSGHYPPSPVLDRRVWIEPSPPAIMRYDNLNYQIQTVFDNFVELPLNLLGYASSNFPVDGPSLAQQAFDRFSTQVPEDLSIGNFFLEWKDTVDLIPGLVKHFADAWASIPKRLRDAPVRQLLTDPTGSGQSVSGSLASLDLGWNFGVAPLIGDLQKIANIVSSVETRLAQLRKLNGKTSRLRFNPGGLGANLYPGPPVIRPSLPLYESHLPHSGTRGSRLVLESGYAHFSASCRLTVQLERLDGLEASLRVLYGRLGLGSPLLVVWNALPFSFVVDWFLGFSDILRRFSIDPFPGQWKVHDLTWSLKTGSRWAIERKWVSHLSQQVRTDTVGYAVEETYSRDLGLPAAELGTLLAFPPTPGQARLLLALSRGLSSYR